MKKTLTAAALSSMLVLGLAAASMAADAPTTTGVNAKGASKITLDGSIRERGTYRSTNVAKDSAGQTMYDNRVQLGVAAQVSEQASGYIQLENGTGGNDWDAWGQSALAADTANNQMTPGGAAGLGAGGNKMGGLNILQAWLNYKPGPWGVKAGHMPLALGNKVFFDHTGSGDDALVFYADPVAGTHIGALTIKFDEQVNTAAVTNDNSDDLDGYVALVTHKLNDNVNLGANWTYLRGGDTNPTATPLAGSELLPGLSMSNMGLTADGKVGAISYMADLELQFGDFADNGTVTKDASGWATKLGADYDFGVGKVGLVFGYGSGKDQRDTDFGAANQEQDQFINFLTDTTYETILVGYRVALPDGALNSGLSNLTLIQLKGSSKVACPLTGKDLSLMASLSYMKTSEDVTMGTVAGGGVNYQDEVGTELDMVATWALTPGLSYKVEAAYLFVGDAYDTTTLGASSNPDDLMFIRHGLDLKF